MIVIDTENEKKVNYELTEEAINKINNYVDSQSHEEVLNNMKKKESEYKQKKIFYKCHCCGKMKSEPLVSDIKEGFPKIYDQIYKGNNYYLPICYNCLEKMYDTFKGEGLSPEESFKRICMRYNLYYNPKIAATAIKNARGNNSVRKYLKALGVKAYEGKTYSDTINDDKIKNLSKKKEDIILPTDSGERELTAEDIELVKFWGEGYTMKEIYEMQDEYDDWTTRNECNTKAQEVIFQTICKLNLQINKCIQSGGDPTKLCGQVKEFLGAGNLQPKQTNDNKLTEQNTFGTLIKKWEMERPISEPEPEWADVDGIGKYVSVWFLGHLCKMIGVKNKWSKAYEDEIKKYTVEKEEYTEDDSDVTFEDIFGNAGV